MKCGLHTVLSSIYYQVKCVGVVEKGIEQPLRRLCMIIKCTAVTTARCQFALKGYRAS